jgi:holo-[acyl-carrier protein] synthase
MKIYGIGSDIISNIRIKKSLKNKKFLKRIFTIEEIKKGSKLKNKFMYFSKRFAAKEAFVKALGTGFRDNINFNSISILNDKKGKPYIKFEKSLNKKIKLLTKKKKLNVFLSLADEKDYSLAFVIIQ